MANFAGASLTVFPRDHVREHVSRWLSQGASPTIMAYIGETCFHNIAGENNEIPLPAVGGGAPAAVAIPLDFGYLPDFTFYAELAGSDPDPFDDNTPPAGNADLYPFHIGNPLYPRCIMYPV